MSIPIYQVDAFTNKPFAGNPAAVCIMDRDADERWMQSVAMEMNLAETAFLRPIGTNWNLRWFTPTIEVDLCGHATLAAAHVLWETGHVETKEAVRFETRSGLLTCFGREKWIEMDFPSLPAEVVEPPKGLLDALGLAHAVVGRSKFAYLVEIGSEKLVRTLVPDFAMIKKIPAVGVIVTARGSGEFDFVSRFFAPQSGINEDPVTGSAHCALAPWWKNRLGKTELLAYQASQRGGIVRVRVNGDRVILGGQAVTTLRGELTVPPSPTGRGRG